MGLTETFKP